MDAAVMGLAASSLQPSQLTFEDGFGERRFATGKLNEPLELLKLSSVLSSVSSFDFALRERAARLTGFRHESYARVRSVELDRRTSALVVSSDYVSGVRLSTLLVEAQERSIPLEITAARSMIRQLVSAAVALQEAAPDVSNGAIAPERLVLTPSGRIVIVEYVLGAALEQLNYSRDRYWRELGIALPGAVGPVLFDARADITAIGVVALALILGRPLAVDEYPERIPELIERATLRSVMGSVEPMPAGLRDWLLQALQMDQWESFASPADAQTSLNEALGHENAVAELGALQVFFTRYASAGVAQDDLAPRLEAMKAFLARYPSRRPTNRPADAPANQAPAAAAPPPLASVPPDTEREPLIEPVRTPPPEPARAAAPEPQPAAPVPVRAQDPPAAAPAADLTLADVPLLQSYADERRSSSPVRRSRRLHMLTALGGVVLVAGLAAAAWYYRTPGAPATGTLSIGTQPSGISVYIDGTPNGVTPLNVQLPPGEHVVELRTDTERRRVPITLTAGGQASQYFEFAPPSQSAGELLVRTDPLGAAVTVDGTYVGRSPVSVPDLTAGTHTVVLQGDAGTLTERVLVESGRTASLVVSMGGAPRSSTAGWIRLDLPTDVQIYENGRRIGASDLERIMLPVGRHELEFVNDALGYRERRTVQVAAGQVSSVSLEWPRGSMALNAVPWAEVFVDGARVGETPIGSVAVPIGSHEVVFRHPDLGERRLSVTVKTGEPIKVGVDLRSK